MIPNQIGKVLSTLHSCRVRYLLMGGQACVFYGAAEFSRDTDIVILADQDNIERLNSALSVLEAECIAVPPLQLDYLARGHPELLVELTRSFTDIASCMVKSRPLLGEAMRGNVDALRSALRDEEERIRAEDRVYWTPLRKELE